MLTQHDFALEPLEDRLETICVYVPYIALCYRPIFFGTIAYPCIKYHRICF